MGREKQDQTYKHVVSMRVSDEEMEKLNTLVQKTNKSVTHIMREAMSLLRPETPSE